MNSEMKNLLFSKLLSIVEMPSNSFSMAKKKMSTGWKIYQEVFTTLGEKAVCRSSQGPVRHSASIQMRLPADVWRVEIPIATLSVLFTDFKLYV